jgi:hypothetical protein
MIVVCCLRDGLEPTICQTHTGKCKRRGRADKVERQDCEKMEQEDC